MDKQLQFAPTVLLIDAYYINKVIGDLRFHFSKVLGRELPTADLSILLECLVLDTGITHTQKSIQALFIYDDSSVALTNCRPSAFETELKQVAFQSVSGEVEVQGFYASTLISREQLFMESCQLIAANKEVEHLILIPDEQDYGRAVVKLEARFHVEKKVWLMGMNPPGSLQSASFEMLGFAVLRALGVRSDELK